MKQYCPVCLNPMIDDQCPVCGYSPSTDYEEHVVLGEILPDAIPMDERIRKYRETFASSAALEKLKKETQKNTREIRDLKSQLAEQAEMIALQATMIDELRQQLDEIRLAKRIGESEQTGEEPEQYGEKTKQTGEEPELNATENQGEEGNHKLPKQVEDAPQVVEDAPQVTDNQMDQFFQEAGKDMAVIQNESGQNAGFSLRKGEVYTFGTFENTPIMWKVIDIKDRRALFLSEYGLIAKQFNPSMRGIEYTDSSIRTWLLNEFPQQIFSGAVRKRIDQLFLLSMEEYQRLVTNDQDKLCPALDSHVPMNWWLRDRGQRSNMAMIVEADGTVKEEGRLANANSYVRPALWVNLDQIAAHPGLFVKQPAEPKKIAAAQNPADTRIIVTGKKEEETVPAKKLPPLNLKKGAIWRFGKYQAETLVWKVIDIKKGNALLLCENGIDTLPYDATTEMNLSKTDWGKSEIRNWMNGTFYKNAFSKGEKDRILETTNTPASQKRKASITDGEIVDIIDHVFALNETELKRLIPIERDRRCKPTSYAKNRGANTSFMGGYCSWWLRNPGNEVNSACSVQTNGSISRNAAISSKTLCVRPAMWITLG